MKVLSPDWRMRARSGLAAVVALIFFVTSVASVAHRSASVQPDAVSIASVVKNSQPEFPKPCQKTVMPGAVNTCPLSSFSVSAIPFDGPENLFRAASQPALWQMSNSSLPAQCGGFSPYRPPCLIG